MTRGQISRREEPLLRHSLRWRLPLFFSALVILMLATFLWATRGTVEGTLEDAGHERARVGAGEVAEILSQGIEPLEAGNERLATDSLLQAFLIRPSDETRDAVRERFMPESAFRRGEIWNAADSLVLAMATPRADSAGGVRFLPTGAAPTREGVSEIKAAGDLSYFDVVVAIRDGPSPDDAHLGYYRRFGQVTTSPDGRLQRLLGEDALLKIGSVAGGVWTDFFTIVDAPPLQAVPGGVGDGRGADGRDWVGASASVPGSPWVVWVGFPRSLVVAPAQPFMRRMVALALVFVAVSVVAAGLLGVRIAQPLHGLARAAEDIAAGDYTRHVEAHRKDEVGRLSRAFNTMTDRIQEVLGALEKSHRQTHFALSAAGIGVWETELATGRMACSDSMRLVLGIPAHALPKTRDAFLDLVHPEDRDAVRRCLGAAVAGGEVFDVQWRTHGAGGRVRWIEGKGQVKLDESGRPQSVLGVSIDATERRRLESQLRQAQKMEAVGQLAGGVAHDFNNLLTSIMGHGSLLLGELKEGNPLREDVAEILRAGDSAAGLTRQLLAFSRRQVMLPEVITLNDVVASTGKLLRRLIGEDIELVMVLAPELESIKADSGHLEQVLVNLVVNARDAMPEGGRLVIETANVDFGEPHFQGDELIPPGRYVMLSVSDTGTGMDPETREHLFEPFYTTKPVGRGTGLGLATVFGIVKQSGGHIYVYSEPGQGTIFKIYLPATLEKPAAPPRRVEPNPVGGAETILIVEDNAPVRAVLRTILERTGYRVTDVSSGEEALATLAAMGERPDLVVSDVVMPGMSGPELARELGIRYPGVKVLFTSGYSGDELVRRGVREPGTFFIEKPYTPSALTRMVREALGSPDESGASSG